MTPPNAASALLSAAFGARSKTSADKEVERRFDEIDGLFGDDLASEKKPRREASAFTTTQFASNGSSGSNGSSSSNGSAASFPGLTFVEYVAPCRKARCAVCGDVRSSSREPIPLSGSIDDLGVQSLHEALKAPPLKASPAVKQPRASPKQRPARSKTRPPAVITSKIPPSPVSAAAMPPPPESNEEPEVASPSAFAEAFFSSVPSDAIDDEPLNRASTESDPIEADDGFERHGRRPFLKNIEAGGDEGDSDGDLKGRLDRLLARAARVGFKPASPPPSSKPPTRPTSNGGRGG